MANPNIEVAYEIQDDYGNCACKVCSPYLHKLYLEKNEILRNSEIICINKKTRKNVNFDEKMNTVSKILLAALMFVICYDLDRIERKIINLQKAKTAVTVSTAPSTHGR